VAIWVGLRTIDRVAREVSARGVAAVA
jgi:hypothetical protein